jgi:hypothetical protein
MNDECASAQFLDFRDEFCSDPTVFTNRGATASFDGAPDCWNPGDEGADIWYVFSPHLTGALIQLFGQVNNGRESLDNAALAIYSGRCGNLTEILCSNVSTGRDDIIERSLSNLSLGTRYYIRVSSAAATAGTFQLCIKTFTPRPTPEQDCVDGVILCDKSSFNIERLSGGGRDPNELAGTCLDNLGATSESSSTWYKWTAKTSGSLTFTLTPNNFNDPEEDLDFALFRLPNGLNDCRNKELLRCMASGETQQNTAAQNAPCFGPTGLRQGSTDVFEEAGCSLGDDNFLAPLNMTAGESYVLVVNNYSNSGLGFGISFGGTGEFEGPTPDIAFRADNGLFCEQTIRFIDQTITATDPIVNYEWNFGEGAVPANANTIGPHDIVYSTFGPKVAALTVTTSRGCSVTEVVDIEVESCCQANNGLTVGAQVIDLTCFNSGDGALTALAGSGSPDYLFSFNGGQFSANTLYPNLDAGDYTLTAQDTKGCEVTETITVNEPEPLGLILTKALDSVALGASTSLSSSYTPSDRIIMYQWSPPNGLSCINCPDPDVIPPGTTTYTLTITDQDGCMTDADITIFTDNNKPFYAPNAIMRGSLRNSRFKIFSNISVGNVEYVGVYDRWGGKIYEETNVDINSSNYRGWDGTFNGTDVNPGVYVWVAKVQFIDGEIRVFSGDISLFD